MTAPNTGRAASRAGHRADGSTHLLPAVGAALRLALGEARPDDRYCNWPAVLDVAMRELLAPVAWTRSRRFIQAFSDRETSAAWRRAGVAAHLRGQHQLDTLLQTLTVLHARGVSPTVLKGIPLGDRLYGDAFVRCSSDIDLYVPAQHRDAAATVLESLGWERDAGRAPWHEAWSRDGREEREYLELHSSLVCDHLAHLRIPGPVTVRRDVAGELLPVLDGAFLPAYLAVHLATHQMPPLLWAVDFASLWGSLSGEEQVAAMRAAAAARVGRYLAWAQERVALLRGAAQDDLVSFRALGFTGCGRRDVHSVFRHLAFAESGRDRSHVLGAFLVPRKLRGSLIELARYSGARVRTRLASLGGAERDYGTDTLDPSTRRFGRPLRLERDEMVTLVRDVVLAGGALRVRAPGGSMVPSIPRGALVRIQGVPQRGIDRGDVVLALTADGEPVLHRVIAVHGDTVTTRGDAALVADPPTPLARVIGIGTYVTHDGVERELERRPPRSLSVAAMKLRRRIARAVRRGG